MRNANNESQGVKVKGKEDPIDLPIPRCTYARVKWVEAGYCSPNDGAVTPVASHHVCTTKTRAGLADGHGHSIATTPSLSAVQDMRPLAGLVIE